MKERYSHLFEALSFHLEFWEDFPCRNLWFSLSFSFPAEVNCSHFMSSILPALGSLQTLYFLKCLYLALENQGSQGYCLFSELKTLNLNPGKFHSLFSLPLHCPHPPKAMDNSDSEGRGLVGNTTYRMIRSEKYTQPHSKPSFCLTVDSSICEMNNGNVESVNSGLESGLLLGYVGSGDVG